MVGLGDLPGGMFRSIAHDVSADGSLVVGEGWSTLGPQAFRWTASGMIGLGDLPGGAFDSKARGVSGDGTTVVGDSVSAAGIEAFRWTATSGMVGLGDLPGGPFGSAAQDVSSDGSVIVGTGHTAAGPRAFIWDSVHETRNLKTVLTNFGIDTSGWTLNNALGISPNGRYIVGNGTSANGDEAFLVDIELSVPVGVPASSNGSVTIGLLTFLFAGIISVIRTARRYKFPSASTPS
jgi:probable HAF family extracellular repeat protein